MAQPDFNLYRLRERLGGTVYAGGTRWLGPGPRHSRHDQSLSVRMDGNRPVIWSFAGDSFTDCLRHLELDGASLDSSPDKGEYVRRQRERAKAEREERARKHAFCASVWGETVPADFSPVATYLRDTRRIALEAMPAALRFHPGCPLAYPWSDAAKEGRAGRSPAMVALVAGEDGSGIGLHVTPISDKGERRGKKLLFGKPLGGAVRLSEPGPDRHLGLAEGLETSLAFSLLHNLPTWAALSTAGVGGFKVPGWVKKLTIAADSDDNGAGLKASSGLAERTSVRMDCFVAPAPAGKDWADVLAEAAL